MHETVHSAGQRALYPSEVGTEHAEGVKHHFRLFFQCGRGDGFAKGFAYTCVSGLLHLQVAVLVEVVIVVLVQPFHGACRHAWQARGGGHAQCCASAACHAGGKASGTSETPQAEFQQAFGDGVAAGGYGVGHELKHKGKAFRAYLASLITAAKVGGVESLHGQVDGGCFEQLLFGVVQCLAAFVFLQGIVQQFLVGCIHEPEGEVLPVHVVAQSAAQPGHKVGVAFLPGFGHRFLRLFYEPTGGFEHSGLAAVGGGCLHVAAASHQGIHGVSAASGMVLQAFMRLFGERVHFASQCFELVGGALFLHLGEFFLYAAPVSVHQLCVQGFGVGAHVFADAFAVLRLEGFIDSFASFLLGGVLPLHGFAVGGRVHEFTEIFVYRFLLDGGIFVSQLPATACQGEAVAIILHDVTVGGDGLGGIGSVDAAFFFRVKSIEFATLPGFLQAGGLLASQETGIVPVPCPIIGNGFYGSDSAFSSGKLAQGGLSQLSLRTGGVVIEDCASSH